jgi:hypothetical protein
MNSTQKVYGNLTINDICKTHSFAFSEAMKRMVEKGFPFNRIQHVFDESDGDEYVICGDDGYCIEKAFTDDGKITMTVKWGTFIGTNRMKKWIDRPESGLYMPS